MRAPILTLAGVALLAAPPPAKARSARAAAPPRRAPPTREEAPAAAAGRSSPRPTAAPPTRRRLPTTVPFEATSPAAYTAKVKTLLTGLPPTAAELASVTGDPKALRALLDTWMATPQFQTKMITFFKNAFQQAQVDNSTLLRLTTRRTGLYSQQRPDAAGACSSTSRRASRAWRGSSSPRASRSTPPSTRTRSW